MAKLTEDIKAKIQADWKAGYSQNRLAKEYQLSPATINKICKGIEQTNVNLVNSKIAVATALQSKSEYEVNSIEKKVNEELRRQNLVYGNAEKLAAKLSTMTDQIDSPSDLKLLAEANDRLAITLKVADRHAPKGDINVQANSMAVSQSLTVEYED